jgi:hypothetical protein
MPKNRNTASTIIEIGVGSGFGQTSSSSVGVCVKLHAPTQMLDAFEDNCCAESTWLI